MGNLWARCEQIAVTTDSTGAGTASSLPVQGIVRDIRFPQGSTAISTGGTSDWTFTRKNDGGTILAITNLAAGAADYSPSVIHYTQAGVAAGTTIGRPVDGPVQVVVAQGAASKSGTVFLYVTHG